MSNAKKIVLLGTAVAATLLAAGCAREHLRNDFGNATQVNHEVQMVNAAAGDQVRPVGSADGKKVEKAVERYRNAAPVDAGSRGKLVSEIGN